jgi:hypothetical protein
VEFVKYMIIVGMSSYKNRNKAGIVYIKGDGPPPSDICEDPEFAEEVGTLFNRLNEVQRIQFYTEHINNEIAIKYLEDYRIQPHLNISEAFRILCAKGYIESLELTRDNLNNILFIDYYIVPIVKAFNKLTPEDREALLTQLKLKKYLEDELREIGNTLTKEIMIEYILENHIDQKLLNTLSKSLVGKTIGGPVNTGTKRGRTLFENNKNKNNNNEGPINPSLGKRLKFSGGTKKRKQKRSRTMKKRK